VWKDGLTLFTHAIAVTKDNFVAHDNLGVELDRRGRFDEAIAQYRETLRIKPGDRNGESNLAQASFEKGERLFNQKKPDEAFASFQEGMQYRPPTASVQMYIGLMLLDRQEFDIAISQLRGALQMDPKLVRAHVGLGVALASTGKDQEARRSFEEAVRLDPSNLEAHFDLGLVLAALGQRGDALRQFEEILKIQPDYAPAREAQRGSHRPVGYFFFAGGNFSPLLCELASCVLAVTDEMLSVCAGGGVAVTAPPWVLRNGRLSTTSRIKVRAR
jgi:tetratricopeptide (TPR) repeat protein